MALLFIGHIDTLNLVLQLCAIEWVQGMYLKTFRTLFELEGPLSVSHTLR